MNQITPDTRYKTWVEDCGWVVYWSIAKPVIRKDKVKRKWCKDSKEKVFKTEEEAINFYNIKKEELNVNWECKQIAGYILKRFHREILKTNCPICHKDAEILDFMMSVGGGLEPNCPIVCEHCKPNFPLSVGEYILKDLAEFTKPNLKIEEYCEDRIIMSIDDAKKYKNKKN